MSCKTDGKGERVKGKGEREKEKEKGKLVIWVSHRNVLGKGVYIFSKRVQKMEVNTCV